jgi:hypothetical protein
VSLHQESMEDSLRLRFPRICWGFGEDKDEEDEEEEDCYGEEQE